MSVHTPGSLRRVPNQPKTPIRGVRIPDDLWERAKKRADENGETLSHAIRKFLDRYSR